MAMLEDLRVRLGSALGGKIKRGKIELLVIPMLYLVMSVLITGAASHNVTRWILDESGDPNVYMLFLKWWPYALLNGHNPFLINSLSYPFIYDTAWMTSIPWVALLSAPITLLFGIYASWNIILILDIAFSATSMWILLKLITKSSIGSFLGGIIYGVSTFEIAELPHVMLSTEFVLPLMIAVYIARMRNMLGNKWFVPALAILYSSELYTSIEVAFTMTCFVVLGILLAMPWYGKEILAEIKVRRKELLLVMVLIIIIVSPLMFYLYKGRFAAASSINSPVVYSTDLLNFIIPTPVTALGGQAFLNISTKFTGNFSESTGYMGIVLLVVLLISIVSFWHRYRWAKPLGLLTVGMMILTLGPVLHVGGNVYSLRLPWYLVAKLPVFNSVLPGRLMQFVWFLLAIWIATWIGSSKIRREVIIKLCAVVAGIIMIWPAASNFYWTRPLLRNVNALDRLNGGVVMFVGNQSQLPFPAGDTIDLLVAESNFHLYTTNAQWGYNPYPASRQPLAWHVEQVNSPKDLGPNAAGQIEAFCSAYHDKYVAVYLKSSQWMRFMDSLHWKKVDVNSSIVLFEVPHH